MVYLQILMPIAFGFALYYVGEHISVKGLMDRLRYESPTMLAAAIALYILSSLAVSILLMGAIYEPFLFALGIVRLFAALCHWGDADATWRVFAYTFIAEGALVAISPFF